MAFRAGILPDQFWRMTLRDFIFCISAWGENEREDMRRRAWQTSWLLAAQLGSDAPNMDELLGVPRQLEDFSDRNPEQIREHMRKRMEELGDE